MKTKRKCNSEGCNNPHFAKGFCSWHQHKRPDFNQGPAKKRTCEEPDCQNPHFAKGFCQQHQFKRPDFKRPELKQTPIKQKSDKLRRSEQKYNRKRKAFLEKKENQVCPVAKYFLQQDISSEDFLEWSRNLKTTEVHHKAGRIGELLLASEYWLAVSRKGHNFIHDNPEFSYSKGWLIKSTTVNL